MIGLLLSFIILLIIWSVALYLACMLLFKILGSVCRLLFPGFMYYVFDSQDDDKFGL